MKNFQTFLLTWVMMLSGIAYAQNLPTNKSTLFSGSGNCAACHSAGGTNTNVLRDSQGKDVSPPALWRSTMMGNAAKDPFWQAKVSAEVVAHPEFKQIIEDKCTTCHSPMGRTEAHYLGQDSYSMQQMNNDPLAMDGVSCTACHQIKDINLGAPESFSGHYIIENDHLIYGPYQNPVARPMQNNSGYTPVFGQQVSKSELCATCHTLFTPTVDNNGEIIGEAPEQTPYLEWKNSRFRAEGVECQTCHVPQIDDPVIISNRPMRLGLRTPFGKHYFVGGNVFMLRILRQHGTELGVTATAAHFDSTIARTLQLLQRETAELTASFAWSPDDTLIVKVAVKNKTGHKFPTAYPSRRAWLLFGLENGAGQSVFISGAWNADTGEINDLDSPYEKHYDVITRPNQVQIYQPLMSDVDGNVNYTLLRAAGYIKDNRIPPEGFTTSDATYDSVAIKGLAASDPNFNIADGVQGSGVDTVTYRIGGLDPAGDFRVQVKLLYQTFAPRFVQDLLQYSTPEIERMQGYYSGADKSPVVIQTTELLVKATGVQQKESQAPAAFVLAPSFPNPFNPSTTIRVQIQQPGRLAIEIFDLTGKKVRSLVKGVYPGGAHRFVWDGQDYAGRQAAAGSYFVQATFREEQTGKTLRQTIKTMLLK